MVELDKGTAFEGGGQTSRRRVWLRRALAWGATIAVVAFLLTRYSPSEIASAVAKGDWLPMIPLIAAASAWALIFMTTADWLLLRPALGPIRWLDVLRGKAGCSLLQALNHAVGVGAYGVWVGRRTKSDVPTTVGVLAYLGVVDLVALFAFVSVAVWVADPLPSRVALRWLAPAAVTGLLATAALGPWLLPKLVPRARLLTAWRRVSATQFLLSVTVRMIALGGLMTATWAAAAAFGLKIPLAAFLAYLPIIYLAAALPINVLGFGPVQFVWVAAFEAWASGAEILAFQFLAQAMIVCAFVLRAVPFLPSVLRDIAPQN